MITIVDYGLGNIRAFQNIYNQLNIDCAVARDTETLRNASKLILPGVGSFDFAMTSLQRSGMRHMLDELVLVENIPLLGICVGMQMLANSSEEGSLDGLGYIDGTVQKFSKKRTAVEPLPHMGWNQVNHSRQEQLFENFKNSERFYFLHSYYFQCDKESDSVSKTLYGDEFTSSVRNKNIYGVQFHPEKSHEAGIRLLKNFGSI